MRVSRAPVNRALSSGLYGHDLTKGLHVTVAPTRKPPAPLGWVLAVTAVAALAALLRDDVEYEMPPIPVWFLGRAAVVDHLTRRVFTRPRRALPTSANGHPAVATYSRAADGSFAPHGIHVLDTESGLISRIVVFLERSLFPLFGLPATLPDRPYTAAAHPHTATS
jgi:hypothetical protein